MRHGELIGVIVGLWYGLHCRARADGSSPLARHYRGRTLVDHERDEIAGGFKKEENLQKKKFRNILWGGELFTKWSVPQRVLSKGVQHRYR